MLTLAIDTSSALSVVSVCDASGRVLAGDELGGPSSAPGHLDEPPDQRHAETLLPRIEASLSAAGLELGALELIAVGIGPGSFTGLRVGLATAKGLALASGVPLRGVESLRVLARGVAGRAEAALVVVDAGRGEVFGCLYVAAADQLVASMTPLRATPEAFAREVAACLNGDALGHAIAVGAGVRRYIETFSSVLGADLQLAEAELDRPQGRHVALEAHTCVRQHGHSSIAGLQPLYMRGSDAQLPARPLRLD
jgi:tRNA threonylcarbamoyladenosine biosynthesis protein TsaB